MQLEEFDRIQREFEQRLTKAKEFATLCESHQQEEVIKMFKLQIIQLLSDQKPSDQPRAETESTQDFDTKKRKRSFKREAKDGIKIQPKIFRCD